MAGGNGDGKNGSRGAGRDSVAVALGYDHGTGEAPRVVAKGRGEVAERIIASAEEHGVHVEENPVLAEALSQVELDDTIPKELYRAAAEVISFVLYQTRQKS